MGAPKGNKYACDSENNGRPRKYYPEEIAKQLDEWIKQTSNVQLSKFCADYDYDARNLSVWAKESKVFSESLYKAKIKIAVRREDLVNKQMMDSKTFNRYQGMFDATLNEFEREEKEFEYALKTKMEQKRDTSFIIEIIDYSKV